MHQSYLGHVLQAAFISNDDDLMIIITISTESASVALSCKNVTVYKRQYVGY